jgi:uncharacterized protein
MTNKTSDTTTWEQWNLLWQAKFVDFASSVMAGADSGHDLAHVRRVVGNAQIIGSHENADAKVVLPAAWLHDCVVVAKNSPQRNRASRLAADHSQEFLERIDYPMVLRQAIHHAITAHSFSANIPPKTLEAKVVQDADRLEALGALGLARCLITGASMGVALMNYDEPFPIHRLPDDKTNSIDHLFVKLLKLPARMQTEKGRQMASLRADFLIQFLKSLCDELHLDQSQLNEALAKAES